MSNETNTIEKETIRQDKMLSVAQRIAKGEANGEFVYCMEEDKFYYFDKGVWRHIYDIEFLALITKHLPSITKFSISRRKTILENYKIVRYKSIKDFNWSEILNLKNGMVNPYNGEMQGHNSIFYSTRMINYDYKEYDNCDLWIKTLNEILDNDNNKINLLQEFFGYCLTHDTRREKALLLLGESRTGKSTILNTLQYVVGDSNCSHVGLEYLINPQYTSSMVNKLVNIDGEVSKKAEAFEKQFKTVVTGHEIKSNDKFMPPFDFRPFCKFVMSANEFPKITDHSSAFYKRLILIPCDRVFEDNEQNINLRDDLIKELPGILNWAIEGLKRLNEKGFTKDESMKAAVKQLEDENNPVNLFFDEYIEASVISDTYIEKGDLYSKYTQWSDRTNNYKLSQSRFASCVFKKFHKQTAKNSRLDNGGKRIWRNLKYIDMNITSQDMGWKNGND